MERKPRNRVKTVGREGSGTLDMIERYAEAHLPSPDFEEWAGLFVTIPWRDWLTDEVVKGLGLKNGCQAYTVDNTTCISEV